MHSPQDLQPVLRKIFSYEDRNTLEFVFFNLLKLTYSHTECQGMELTEAHRKKDKTGSKQEGLTPGISRFLASFTRLRARLSTESPLGFPCVTQRFSHCNQINMCSFEIKAKERMIASFH